MYGRRTLRCFIECASAFVISFAVGMKHKLGYPSVDMLLHGNGTSFEYNGLCPLDQFCPSVWII
jgi:hypothetical protein